MNTDNATIEHGTPKESTEHHPSDDYPPEAGPFRTIFPQILASTAKNFLLLDLGLAIAFPTIVIPALRGITTNTNPNERLSFTAIEASWFGSIAFICQPIGSVLSGWITEPLGRKRAMILVNIPHIIAWILLYTADSLEVLFTAGILLGLGVGFMEAPIVTYVGEICQPSIRGILTACAGVSVMLGILIVYLLGTQTTFRIAALICMSVPLATAVAICFVPETPLWLLSKNREDEALKSLQWLRGWVSPKAVYKEFLEIKRYSANSIRCTACEKSHNTAPCDHPKPSFVQNAKELIRKRTLKPFTLVMAMFFISQFSGLASIRPYIVQIFQAYNVPVDPSWATVLVGVMGLLANIVGMAVVRLVGKRKLYLISVSGTCFACWCLGIYAYNKIPAGWSSFDKHEQTIEHDPASYFPMVMLYFLSFATSLGLVAVPWMMLSEVFPFKTRGIATGIAAALNYLMGFVSTKTYLNFEQFLSLSGVMFMYGFMNIIGLIFMYIVMPETERRTLEDIEYHFSRNDLKFTDRVIEKDAHLRLRKIEALNPRNDNSADQTKRGAENGLDNRAFHEESF